MNDLYSLTLDKLGNLSLEVHIEVHTHFDVLTGMSWKTALDTIDARLGSRSDKGNGQLGHWKTIIEMAYAEFQANLPGFEPPLFDSLVLAADGRSESSKFPNLIAAEEREPYGL